jgi:HEAT repeat protein
VTGSAGAGDAAETGRRAEPASARRRASVALAGHAGNEAVVRESLDDAEPKVRLAALTALVRLGRATPSDVARLLEDPDSGVRRGSCEIAATVPGSSVRPLLDDDVPAVVEAAAFAAGELGELGCVPRLCAIAREHDDPLCREAAVAALGALGDPKGKDAVLEALHDVPATRRRAVVALAAFDGDDVDDALRARLGDRDWQVRQAAEDVLGVSDGTST